MRIFIYEFVTGGGWYDVDPTRPPAGSLLAEGRAMVEAVARDFLAIKDVEVAALHDRRLKFRPPTSKSCLHTVADSSEGDAKFQEQAEGCDFTLIIAPEFDDHLLRRTWQVEQRKLLSPSAKFVWTCGDKWLTYLRLQKFNTPKTWRLDRQKPKLPDAPYPLVVKPQNGCGSQGVQLLMSERDRIDWGKIPEDAIVQRFCPGEPISVAFLQCGERSYPLMACRQILSQDGRFSYLGGECPLPPSLAQRAYFWATWPWEESQGFFGVDMVLGDAEDGSQDYVIEVNPRLTTSYVGLRALSNTNLAQTMLDVAMGRELQLDWKPGRVRWSADGVVEYFEP